MRSFSIILYLGIWLSRTSCAQSTQAPAIIDNPDGVQYIAKINMNGIIGEILVETPSSRRGVSFSVNINGNMVFRGPNFSKMFVLNRTWQEVTILKGYHIHELPVPADHNCTAVRAHLDPFNRGEDPICDRSNPSSCQVGDLSGKHGDIFQLPGFTTRFNDDYVALTPGVRSFIGDKSIVLHTSNKTRIACANFQLVQKNVAVGANIQTIVANYSNCTKTLAHGTYLPSAIATTSGNMFLPTGSFVLTAQRSMAGRTKLELALAMSLSLITCTFMLTA